MRVKIDPTYKLEFYRRHMKEFYGELPMKGTVELLDARRFLREEALCYTAKLVLSGKVKPQEPKPATANVLKDYTEASDWLESQNIEVKTECLVLSGASNYLEQDFYVIEPNGAIDATITCALKLEDNERFWQI